MVYLVEVVILDQIALSVGVLPVTPEGDSQAVPPRIREVRDVWVDQPLPVLRDITGRR